MQFAIQTIIFGRAFLTNFDKCLRLCKETGYSAIETNPAVFNESASQLSAFRSSLSDNGLHLAAVHTSTDSISSDTSVRHLCERAVELNCKHIISSGYLADYRRDQLRETADRLSEISSLAKAYGLIFSYHHHDFELQETTLTGLAIDDLMRYSDESVGLVIDTYWAEAAIAGFRTVWERYCHRCHILHLKDGDPKEHSFSTLGNGTLPVDRFFAMAMQRDLHFITYEQDLPEDFDERTCLEESLKWYRRQQKS